MKSEMYATSESIMFIIRFRCSSYTSVAHFYFLISFDKLYTNCVLLTQLSHEKIISVYLSSCIRNNHIDRCNIHFFFKLESFREVI